MNNRTPAPLMNLIRHALILLIGFLSGCDGGLFGTGDGSDINISTPPATDSPSSPNESVSGASDNLDSIPNVSFSNTLSNANLSEEPLIRLVNLTNQGLNLQATPSLLNVFEQAIEPLSYSSRLPISLGTNRLVLLTAFDNTAVLTVDPLNAASRSLTTLLAYSTSMQPLVLARLASETTSRSPSTAILRVVQGAPINGLDTIGTLRLIPQTGNLGSAEIPLNNIGLNAIEQTVYIDVLPGDYLVIDDDERLPRSSVQLVAGNSYTLIVTGEPVNPYILINESNP